MTIDKKNEFTNLVNQTFDQDELERKTGPESVLLLDICTLDERIFSATPYFSIHLRDVLLNSVYIPLDFAEVIIFNKALCQAFCAKTGIPEMYVGCLVSEGSSKMILTKSEKNLLEALDIASSYELAG
jgi:hypothetical protein